MSCDHDNYCGWNEEAVLHNRLDMYKRFNAANPQVKGIGSILTIIYILQAIYYLVQLIKYFNSIDSVLIKEYTVKQSNSNYNVVFEDDLSAYIQRCLKKQT